ncbi:MAG TPA: LPXTG cell wall anchor domain-containing protein [Mycobacteriales bacterium]|nr:LPXTG cell wall anchor domain-containing protein [Mycobacteriales bacterium]
MAQNLRRRGAAAAALTVASGTLLATVAVAAPAGAATNVAPAFYSGATQGNVLGVTLNLPTALPGLPNPAALGLISATGTAVHNTLSAAVTNTASSFAGLASGSLVQSGPLGMLNRSASATTSGARDATSSLGTIPSNVLVSGSLGSLAAHVLSALPSSVSTANLANLSAGRLRDILGSSLVNQITSVYNSIESNAQSTVSSAVSTIDSVLGPLASQDPTGAAALLESQVNSLPSQLDCSKNTACLLNTLLDNNLLSFDALDAHQGIVQVADGVQSTAHAGLLGVNVLGGLVSVNGFTSDATAFADGRPGHATAAVNPVVATAKVGKLQITLGNGATGTILGINVGGLTGQTVTQINSALTTVVNTLNSVLNTLGVSVSATKGTTSVNPDGSSATATGGVLTIDVSAPSLPTGGAATTAGANSSSAAPLVQIQLGGASAAARARQAVLVPNKVITPATTALPHTGANLPLTAGIGMVLLGAAALVRRRLMSNG